MKLKILFMSANPSLDLNLDEEIRNVQMAIEAYSKQDSVEMIQRTAVRLKDMINILNREKPHILHFAGHGYAESGELYMIDSDTKKDKIIPNEALSLLFETVKDDNLKLVFLNSCYSKYQADAILESIDYVIGMNNKIEDDSSKTLSTQFYSSFVVGVSLVNSFKQAKVEVIANHFSQKSIPELLIRNDGVQDFSMEDIIGDEEQLEGRINFTITGDVKGIGSVSGGTVTQMIKDESRNITQTHSGFGDNVTGNKVVHNNQRTINTKNNFENIENKGTINFGDNIARDKVVNYNTVNPNINYKEKLKEMIENFDSGNMIFNTPKTMSYGESEIVTLRISKTDIFTDDLPQENQQIEDRIKVHSFMSANLKSRDFDIMLLTEEEQFLGETEHTEWKWDIESIKKKSKGILYLQVTIRIPLDSHREEKRDLPVLKRKITIQLN